MLEYPELNTITNQMKKELIGKTITSGVMVKRSGNMFMGEDEPLKYVLLNRGKIIDIDFFAPEIFIVLDNGYGILFCQSGGSILYHKAATDVTKNCNIRFDFSDGSCLTYTMLLWTLGIYAITCDDWNLRKKRNEIQYFKPLDKNTFEDYLVFIDRCKEQEKMSIKIFLSKFVSGVMSTFAAEILLYAKIYPSVQLKNLNKDEHRRIYESIINVLTLACEKGGRTTEFNLYKQKGSYKAMAERKNIGKDCPVCGNIMAKNSTGGVTAFCPVCQVKNK